jgi:hypothetical protein
MQRTVTILRTRDAELKGFEELTSEVRDKVLPLIELTKSRRSKNNPDGAIDRCFERLGAALGDRPFIVDVTTMDSLSSAETWALLEPARHFSAWRRFIANSFGSNCIPLIHLTSPLTPDSIRAQLASLLRISGKVAVRVPPDYEDAEELRAILEEETNGSEQVVLVVDCGFVNSSTLNLSKIGAEHTLRGLGSTSSIKAVAASSFPSSVVLPNYGGDDYGKFKLLEVQLSKQIQGLAGLEGTLHGDYGSIHPKDFKGIVTSWVPRVDVPLDEEVFYYRYRRDAGGYVKAAAAALDDKDYIPLKCWADTNIRSAATGSPLGRSPAHWIACRVNFHVSRQVARLT